MSRALRRFRCQVPSIRFPAKTVSNIPDINPLPVGLTDEAQITIDSETFTINSNELKEVASLGSGHYADVVKALHVPTGRTFAVKHIRQQYAKKPEIHRDLVVGVLARHPSIVTTYCGLFSAGVVSIIIEPMDISLDKLTEKVYKAGQIFPSDVLAYIVLCVVEALEYLHSELKVIHRDVKPSNILASRHGEVKVCDFGISGFLENSLVQTDVGSNTYLAPERISSTGNLSYGIHVDVWSLGLSVLELATGKHGYPPSQTPFEHLQRVVNSPPPCLPEISPYSNSLRSFIDMCLVKNEKTRANYLQLLDSEFIANVNKSTAQTSFKVFLSDYIDLT